MKIKLKQISGFRVISTGTDLILPGATLVLDTKKVNPGETVFPSSFVTNAAAGVQWCNGAAAFGNQDTVSLFFQRTAIANEFNLVAVNSNPFNSRTISWAIIGFTP